LPKPTSRSNIFDFRITPAWVLGGALLWRHTELRYVTGQLLSQTSRLFIALTHFVVFQEPVLSRAPLLRPRVVVMKAMALI
jgi:hypothetical protein